MIELYTQLQDRKKLETLLQKMSWVNPQIGVELEFYVAPSSYEFINFKTERGAGQYEVPVGPNADLISLINEIAATKKEIEILANKNACNINWSPKPYENDYGSSCNINISLNIFNDANIDFFASCLCHFMLETFLIYAPSDECYRRFVTNYHCPTHIGYGRNNRTAAIRIPSAGPLRIEHRVPSNSIDLYAAFYTILKSLDLALMHPSEISKYQCIYGVCSDAQYNLKKFPNNLAESYKYFCYNTFLE